MNLRNLANRLGQLAEKIRYSRSFWLYLAVIFLALGSARLVNALVVFYLAPPVIPASSADKINLPERRYSAVDPSSLLGGALFENAAASLQTTATAASGPAAEVPFVLTGTLEGDPSFARAVIRTGGATPSSLPYAIGQSVGNARILAIERNFIWVMQNGQKIKIEVGQQSTDAQSRPEVASGGAIVKVISREDVNQKILGNPAAIYQGARFGPMLEEGKIVGYKIYSVEESHVFYSLGARSGDVLKSVNGYPLSDTERMFELWKSIKGMSRVDAVIEREGKLLNFQLHIRN